MAQDRSTDEDRARELDVLIERVTEAEGPDREIDKAIYNSLPLLDRHIGGMVWSYTASVDAALGLVPEGWGWQLVHKGLCKLWWLRDEEVGFHGKGATPALAVCIAALHARRYHLSGAQRRH